MSDSLARREFLKTTGAAVGAAAASEAARAQSRGGRRVQIHIGDGSALPVLFGANELQRALQDRGVDAVLVADLIPPPGNDLHVTLDAGRAATTVAALKDAKLEMPDAPECLALTPVKGAAHETILAAGSDTRGLVYALLELADRVRHAPEPMGALTGLRPVVERPANAVRSIARLFTSDVHDKPWFHDREMWPAYLTMLAGQRFNRFNLSVGIGYDFLREVTDAYFLFPYPFLLTVPGYNVRAVPLPDAERDGNLEMLKFISEQTAVRGMEFQLGLWMHGYQWINSPNPNYTIEGLTADTHGPYCRDALGALLKACPAISGVTFRIHGESGVAEGSYSFWKTVFDGVKLAGRKVEIDMHAKGIDQNMIDVGLATGMPVRVSPKFWAEHMGMPYHQTDIRQQEVPQEGRTATGLMALSAGSRSFTRYGYADLLKEDRRYSLIHRIWPGTQRLLLWGDPVTAAGYSRAFRFCGSDGVEICEPLSFKGRRGSGIAGDRCGYADASLRTRWDWQKYEYTYRVWGRLLYNPAADADSWRRYLRTQFGAAGPAVEAGLSHASRILPMVTTAHGPSAANNTYWPEMYTNQPMVDARKKNPYTDTPSPKTFGNASAFDPQLFSRMNDFAGELLKGERSGKYSPVEVAQWLEDLAAAASKALTEAEGKADASKPEFRRLAIDVKIQAGLGRFFGAKFRAGVLYGIYEQTKDRAALEGALKAYRGAREVWAGIADAAKGVYVADVTVGEHPWLRGHWQDRLAAMDDDIGDMAKLMESATASADPRGRAAIQEALGRPRRGEAPCRHSPPARFRIGQGIELEIAPEVKAAGVRLYYRHVNQAERFRTVEMKSAGARFAAAIPAEYTNSPYPLEYYFEVRGSAEKAWLYPGFTAEGLGQPYFVVRGA